MIKNIGGTTWFVGTPTAYVYGEDNSSCDAFAIAADTNDALVVQVSGAGSADVRWVVHARTAEVAY